MHGFIDSPVHRLIISIRWFTDWIGSPTHYILCSCNAPLHHGFVDALIHWIIDDHWLINSYWRIDSSIHSFIDSLIHWFIRSVVRGFSHVISSASQPAFAHSLMHLTTWSIRCSCIAQTFLLAIDFLYIVISYFRNFRLGACRALSGIPLHGQLAETTWFFPRPDWD